MAIPFESFQQGLMTGAQIGGRARENSQRRQIGGLMASGDYAGASLAAFQGGDLQTGQDLQTRQSQLAEQQRGADITSALREGNYDGAMSFASSPEELQAIDDFRSRASEREREQAVQQAGNMAAIIESIQSLPPEQQFAAVQRYAPQFGIDPARLTPQSITPQALEGYRIQALGLKDYLSFRDREADNARQDRVAEAQVTATGALATQRQASANASNARAGKTRASSGGGAPSSARPATAAPRAGGGALPPGFTIRRR